MSAFSTTAPDFESFLASAKDNPALVPGSGSVPANSRFIPRNFLIEERLDPVRVASYAALPAAGLTTFVDWNKAHNDYVDRQVFVKPPAGHDHHAVATDNPSVCPETFRAPLALSTFSDTDFDTYLIRMVAAADLAWLSGANEDRIFEFGQQLLADPRPDNPARDELSRILDDAYFDPRCDHRPLFAAFYEDFLDDLRGPADASWPNRIRDRLGLYHYNQWQSSWPRRVLLFRYPVRDIPRRSRESDRRPIAVPTVADQRFSEAFCPAPREVARGRTVNLEINTSREPAREVLHPFMPMQVEYLFRVGRVTQPVPEDLAPARRDHLIWLRLLAERDGYAADTDGDLFVP
ncbi:MAG: hypothetical protein NTY19_20140 [Planctomycetota bacterium]|nr:hypothetical protein [Planctomycetota bacterium]